MTPVMCYCPPTVLLVGTLAYSTVLCASQPLDMEALLLASKDRAETLKAVEISDYFVQVPGEPPANDHLLVQRMERKILVDMVTGRFLYERWIPDPADQFEGKGVKAAFDGVVETLYAPDINQGVIAEKQPTYNWMKEAEILALALLHPPKSGGYGLDDASLVSYLKHGILRDGLEQANGRKCHVVDAPFGRGRLFYFMD